MKYTMRSFLLAIAFMGTASHAMAECVPTPRVQTAKYPGAASIPTSNNLLLPAGKSIESDGQRLVVSGQVLDKHCLPVPNAVVELWQATPYGKAHVAEKKEMLTPYPTFAGAGRTVTDVNGQFTFTTAFPGVYGYVGDKKQYSVRAPQLNLRINAPDMADFSTALFFENDRRNDTDVVYKRLSLERRSAVTMRMSPMGQDLHGDIQIVLPSYTRYRTY